MSGGFRQGVGVEDARDVGGGATAGRAVEGNAPPGASSAEDARSGSSLDRGELQEGQTNGFWSRSEAIRIRASGARYSLMPRRPTVGPSGGGGAMKGTLARHRKSTEARRPAQRRPNAICTAEDACRSPCSPLALIRGRARPRPAQATHLVKFRADTVAKEYRIEPAVVVAHPQESSCSRWSAVPLITSRSRAARPVAPGPRAL